MRLKKAQKEILLEWVAEGLETDEINKRAADYIDPFDVSRQQVDHYRKTRQMSIAEIQANGEYEALNTGLAKVSKRVEKLKQLAARLEEDLFAAEDKVWTLQVKGVGSGPIAEIVEYYEFNRSEVDAYRGVLDDIAKETGGRVQRSDITSDGKQLQPITTIEIVKRYESDE